MLVSELISEPSKLCQVAIAVNADGQVVPAKDKSAVSWCVSGGIIKCYTGKEVTVAHEKFRAAIGQECISDWSDSHSFEEVHRALLLAGI